MTRAPECPICRKSVVPPDAGKQNPYPFCSERCRQVDLLRWSQGQYAIVEPLSPEQLLSQAREGEQLDPDDV